MERLVAGFLTATFCLSAATVFAENPAAEVVAEKYEIERIKVNATDQLSRTVMGSLYEINRRMKSVSRKRDDLNNKMLSVEGGVKILARNAGELESRLNEQRHQLSKRLRAMYLIGDEGVVRVLFSSSSAQDLDQSLKFLRLISKHDIELIRNYRHNLQELNRKRERLGREVKSLLSIKDRIKKQELQLETDQTSKAGLLHKLAAEHRRTIEKMAALRGKAEDQQLLDLMNLSFFEQKGQLVRPVDGAVSQAFGLTQSEDYRYKLSHKGFEYLLGGEKPVKAVFKGRISFAGNIDGYGETIIIDHGDHYYTVYAGLDSTTVSLGQRVDKETRIASAKSKMYFELRHFSDAIDPGPWLKQSKSL